MALLRLQASELLPLKRALLVDPVYSRGYFMGSSQSVDVFLVDTLDV